MTIRNILVAFNGTEGSEAALTLGLVMASQHDAYLTGLFAHALPAYAAHLDPYLSAAATQILTEQEAESEQSVRAAFEGVIAAEGAPERVRFLIEQGTPDDVYARAARTYDLLITGQPTGTGWNAHREAHPDTVALRSGRPVLVAPKTYRPPMDGSGVVLAWDGQRAASRALADAMDFIETTGKVTVLHVGESDDEIRKPGADIMEHLSRHGISTELLTLPRAGREISEIVLEISQVSGAGMLVMGAYEHSKFSEQIFGGVTRDVLRHAKIPVLISH